MTWCVFFTCPTFLLSLQLFIQFTNGNLQLNIFDRQMSIRCVARASDIFQIGKLVPSLHGPWSLDCCAKGLGLLSLEIVCNLQMMAVHCFIACVAIICIVAVACLILNCSFHILEFCMFNAIWFPFSHPIHWQPPARPHML